MKTLINQNHGASYVGDILMRMYPNQERKDLARDYEPSWFCFDIHCRNGANTQYEGYHKCDHPQGIQSCVELLLNEQADNDVLIEFDNDFEDGRPHPDNNYHKWFEQALTNAIRGLRKYHEFHPASQAPVVNFLTIPDCPLCGAPMALRQGSYGTFWGCMDYPECEGTRRLNVLRDGDPIWNEILEEHCIDPEY